MEKRTAVVIDDEPDMANYISSVLEEQDFEVVTANDAATGEALIRENRPNVILLDLMMPGRTGIQLFARLRGDESVKDIPLVMVTGIKQELNIDWSSIVDNLRTRKPDGFVEKPIDPKKLLKVVEDVLAGKGKDGEIMHG